MFKNKVDCIFNSYPKTENSSDPVEDQIPPPSFCVLDNSSIPISAHTISRKDSIKGEFIYFIDTLHNYI